MRNNFSKKLFAGRPTKRNVTQIHTLQQRGLMSHTLSVTLKSGFPFMVYARSFCSVTYPQLMAHGLVPQP